MQLHESMFSVQFGFKEGITVLGIVLYIMSLPNWDHRYIASSPTKAMSSYHRGIQ